MEVLAIEIRRRIRSKKNLIWKKKKLNSHFTDDMILYMEDLKDTTEKLVFIKEFAQKLQKIQDL